MSKRAKLLHPGDVVRQTNNRTWWWMREEALDDERDRDAMTGVCVVRTSKNHKDFDHFTIGYLCGFGANTLDPGVEIVPPGKVPDEVWAEIGRQMLTGGDP